MDQTPASASVPTVPPAEPKPSGSALPWILVIIFAIAAAVLGYQNWRLVQQVNQLTAAVAQERGTPPEQIVPPQGGNTATDSADYNGWTDYTDATLTFKYPGQWTRSGSVLTGANPVMNITVAADTTLYNECMKESGTEEKTGFVVRRFTGVTTGEACSGTSATQAEAWLVKSADSFGPGIKITYPPDNEVAVQVTELVIGSFSFTK